MTDAPVPVERLGDVDPAALRSAGADRGPSGPRADRSLAESVRGILAAVAADGDEAVARYTKRFDGADVAEDALEVPPGTVEAAVDAVPDAVRSCLERVRDRVETVQRALLGEAAPRRVESAPGVTVTVRDVPLARVGCYVPGGRAAYPSTVLMTVVPARVAGVGEVVVATPPGPDGAVPDVTLAACALAGADRVFRMGGVQAVAAMAFGTASVPRVDAVVGPGNAYVNEAKAQLYGRVGLDLPAGPTELVIVADGAQDAKWVAADLLAQAEHDADARAVLVTDDRALADAVQAALSNADVEPGEDGGPDEDAAPGSIRVLLADDLDAAAAWVDAYAPEHLQVMLDDTDRARTLADAVTCGTAFVGAHASAVLGDYATGADHVLPTGGAARFAGALSVSDFMVARTVQEVSADGFAAIAGDARVLAEAEALDAHRRAVEVRS